VFLAPTRPGAVSPCAFCLQRVSPSCSRSCLLVL
jgi:hypothetical protein